MDKIKIRGGKPLSGSISISGSKNAALPIIISSILADGPCSFSRVPNLQDIKTVLNLLSEMGVEISEDLGSNKVTLQCKSLKSTEAPYDLVRKMRASVVVLGPLVARFGKAKVSLPGGCAIGARPVNYHLAGLEALGAKIELENGYINATARRLKGARVPLEFPSVGATENLLMAAVLAEGETILENCAKEPEVTDLAQALRAMGAVIEGEGTETIHVQGKKSLHGCNHEIIGDRIEAGTYLAAAFATGGDIEINGISPGLMEAVLAKLEKAGACLDRRTSSLRMSSSGRPRATDVTTAPYPGFPTDMQAQFMAAMAVADGASVITETIFENRFMHVPELVRLGADITIRGNSALIRGKSKLIGAPLMATDLRASAGLIIGGLCADGETVINRIYHLDRGYEQIEQKLAALGADIERIKG
ncbi:MAG: UDP-N-acetylglucosamine 1-carboxyvinyltransferase [Bdellovibrionota bacterium]